MVMVINKAAISEKVGNVKLERIYEHGVRKHI